MTDRSEEESAPGTSAKELGEDSKSLLRGAITNAFGYLVGAGEPLLTLAVVRLFGASVWGAFIFAESISYFATRIATLGLDKGVMWRIARSKEGDEYRISGLDGVLVLAMVASAVVTGLGLLIAEPLVVGVFKESTALPAVRIMLLSTPLTVLVTILLHAILGTQSVGPNVAMRNAVIPWITRLLPLGAFAVGHQMDDPAEWVAIGHLMAFLVATVITIVLLRRRFAEVNVRRVGGFAWPDKELLRYSLPAGGADLLSSILVRIDVWMLALLLDAEAVGIYGVVLSLAKSVGMIRRAFTPVVIPIMSEAAKRGQSHRVRVTYSQTAFMVAAIAGPIFAAIWAFSEELMNLYGDAFTIGALALLIMSAGNLFHGIVGLANTILEGAGRTDLVLLNQVLLTIANVALNYMLIPPFGIIGAAMATSTSMVGVATLEFLFARRLMGEPICSRDSMEPIIASAGALFIAGPTWWFVSGVADGLPARTAGFIAFVVVYALWFRSRGLPTFQKFRRGEFTG